MARRLNAKRAALALTCALTTSAVAACDWPWRHDMVDAPSQPGAAAPRPAVPQALPIGAALPPAPTVADALRNPFPTATPSHGRALYAVYCAPCHGLSGTGDGPVARYYVPVGDLTKDDVQRHTDGWLYGVIVNGVIENGTAKMPRYAHELSLVERWEVVHFLRQLARGAP
jgi:S-disulfanyl-L-cysteine oxidoreductase SoxD